MGRASLRRSPSRQLFETGDCATIAAEVRWCCALPSACELAEKQLGFPENLWITSAGRRNRTRRCPARGIFSKFWVNTIILLLVPFGLCFNRISFAARPRKFFGVLFES